MDKSKISTQQSFSVPSEDRNV